MHAVEQHYITKVLQGLTPPGWGTGDDRFMRAKVVAALAWHQCKAPGDPELPECDLSHQEKLVAEVEDLLTGSIPGSHFAHIAAKLITEITTEEKNTNAHS